LKRKIADRFIVLQSLDEIHNYIEKDQLLNEFGGNIHYTPDDWIEVIKGNIEYQKLLKHHNHNMLFNTDDSM